MTYEEFRGELLEKLEKNKGDLDYNKVRYYEDGFTSDDPKELADVQNANIKFNKTESDVLIGDFVFVYMGEKNRRVCRFLCKELFESYEKGAWEAVWTVINTNIKASNEYAKLGIIELMEKNEYESLKEKLFIRPLNYSDHRYELKGNVYRQMGDIVLVLYLLASDENVGDQHNVVSVKLPMRMMEKWGLSEDEVWESAMTNTYMMAPPRMYINPLDAMNAPYHKGAFMALNSDITSLSANAVPTITTTKQMNGSIAMFYPGVKERIAELFGGDYYVAFMGIHSVMVHKKGTVAPISILRGIKDTNRAFDPSEILSRKVYLYERGAKGFKQLEL